MESKFYFTIKIFFFAIAFRPCSCYVLYNLFFADFDTTLGVYTWGIFFHTLFILAIICISAADVSSEVVEFT